MNNLEEQIKELSESLTEDLVLLASHQTSLSSIRRGVETRNNTAEIKRLTKEIEALTENITGTRSTLDILMLGRTTPVAAAQQVTTLPKELPVMNVAQLGAQFDIQDFLDVFESKLESISVPKEQWPPILLSCVPPNDLATLHWIREHVLNVSWEDAKKKLLAHYLCADTERTFNNLFLSMKMQTNQNIRHFADQFQFCVRKAKLSPTSALVRDRFLHAIPGKLKDQVLIAAAQCASLDELINLVISVNEIDCSLQKFSMPIGSSLEFITPINNNMSTIRPVNHCERHGSCNHSTSECRALKLSTSNATNLPKPPTATKPPFNPTRRVNAVAAENAESEDESAVSSSDEDMKPCTCNIHSPIEVAQLFATAYDAPVHYNVNSIESSISRRTVRPITVNGIPAFCQLDSGSDISLMPSQLVERLNLKTTSCKVKLQFAHKDMQALATECTEEVQVKMGDVEFIWRFYVCDLSSNDICLFGDDIWQKLGLEIINLPNFVPSEPSETIIVPQSDVYHADNILQKFCKLISNEIANNLSTSNQFCNLPYANVKLELLPEAQPSWVSQYRIKPAYKTIVDEQVKLWFKNGIVAFSTPNGNWNSSLIVVRKVNELTGAVKHRVCLDPRHINKVLKDDRYPIPRLRDILDNAAGFSYFTTLDLESSFHQLKLDEESSSITSFTWENVHYRFIGAPFGLKTLTSVFQRLLVNCSMTYQMFFRLLMTF